MSAEVDLDDSLYTDVFRWSMIGQPQSNKHIDSTYKITIFTQSYFYCSAMSNPADQQTDYVS